MTRATPLTDYASKRMLQLLLQDGELKLRLCTQWVHGQPIEAAYAGYTPKTLTYRLWSETRDQWAYPEQVFTVPKDLAAPMVIVGYYVTTAQGTLLVEDMECGTLRWAGDELAITIGVR